MSMELDMTPVAGDLQVPDARVVVGAGLVSVFLAVGWAQAPPLDPGLAAHAVANDRSDRRLIDLVPKLSQRSVRLTDDCCRWPGRADEPNASSEDLHSCGVFTDEEFAAARAQGPGTSRSHPPNDSVSPNRRIGISPPTDRDASRMPAAEAGGTLSPACQPASGATDRGLVDAMSVCELGKHAGWAAWLTD